MNISYRSAKKAVFSFVVAAIAIGGVWSQPTAGPSSPPAVLVTYPIGDPFIFLGGAGLVASSYLLEARKPKPNQTDLSAANIPPFDRWYTSRRSEPLSLLSDITLAGTVLLPAVMIPTMSRDRLIAGGVVYAEALALSFGLKSLIKGLVVRYRPYAYSATSTAELRKYPEIEDSFPSGHVTVAFAAAVATGYIFSLYNPSPGERAAVWGTSLGLATATAVLRVWSGNHFVSDVVGGAAVGSLVGVLLPFLHSPSSMSSTGLSPAVKSVLPSGGLPIVQWDIRLP